MWQVANGLDSAELKESLLKAEEIYWVLIKTQMI